MRGLKKYWKVVLAVILAAAAIPVTLVGYLGGRADFDAQRDALDAEILTLQATIVEGARYADMQEERA